MVHFLYQRFIIFTKSYDQSYSIIKGMNYTNYKVVVLCDKDEDILPSTPFVEYLFQNTSKNNAIFNYSESLIPNDILLFTDIITDDMLITLNNIFLTEKPRLITNSRFYEKSFKLPQYWCCKNYVIQKLNKQISMKNIEKLDLLLACGDICGNTNIVVKELFPIENNVLCEDKSIRIRYNYVPDTIHIIMATYERNKNLEAIFNSLCNQTENKFHFHLLDNNTDIVLQKEINNIIDRFSEKINISLHRYNYNYHCIARLYIIRNLIKLGFVEYVILFDDDQIHHNDWVENLLHLKTPVSTVSWYGKIFDKKNYWFKGSDLKKILTYTDIERHNRPEIKNFKYFGPGGCIFDVNLFLFNELYDFQKYSNLIFKLDDIWLSFSFDKYLNIPFKRMIYHPKECIDRNNTQNMTWVQCKDDKPILFNYLSDYYGWDVLRPQRPFITVNSFFSKIYVLFNEKEKLSILKNQYIQLNLPVHFVFSQNRESTIRDIFLENVQECSKSILIFDQNIVFHKFFHHLFDKYIQNVPANWNILYLGQDTCKIENDAGIFPLTRDATGLHGVGYSLHAMESLLAYELNDKAPVIFNNKILEKTVINGNYFIHPGLVVNDIIEDEKIDFYNLFDSINIPITVYLFDIDIIPNIHYSHCIFKKVQDIKECETDFFVVINNKVKSYFDPFLVNNGIFQLITKNINKYSPRHIFIEYVDEINYNLWCNYVVHANKDFRRNNTICFYKKEQDVCLTEFETMDDKKIFIF